MTRRMYRRARYGVVGFFTNLRGRAGDKATLGLYRLASKIFKIQLVHKRSGNGTLVLNLLLRTVLRKTEAPLAPPFAAELYQVKDQGSSIPALCQHAEFRKIFDARYTGAWAEKNLSW